jgi:hypothetical protein
LWRGVHPEGIYPEGEIGGEVKKTQKFVLISKFESICSQAILPLLKLQVNDPCGSARKSI